MTFTVKHLLDHIKELREKIDFNTKLISTNLVKGEFKQTLIKDNQNYKQELEEILKSEITI